MKLGDLIKARVGEQEADFWIVRRGSEDQVGRPTKTFNPQHIGIKVIATDSLDPNYLYYFLEYLWSQGIFKKIATGSLRLVNIKVSDILNIPVQQ